MTCIDLLPFKIICLLTGVGGEEISFQDILHLLTRDDFYPKSMLKAIRPTFRRHLERRLPVSGLERCPGCHPERSFAILFFRLVRSVPSSRPLVSKLTVKG